MLLVYPSHNTRLFAKFILISVCVMLISCSLIQSTSATRLWQSGGWSDPISIAENASGPVVVGDTSGKLHLFYVEGAWDKQADPSSQAIMYLSGEGQDWSETVDILLSPIGSALYLDAVVLDDEGYLHLLWNDNQTLYHSTAHVEQAGNPQEWQTVAVLKGPIPVADMAQDPSGKLHIIARQDEFTLSYTSSDDSGLTWTRPAVITTVDDPVRYAIGGLNLVFASPNTIHVTWTVDAAEVNWNFWSVWYARSSDGGATWDIVKEMAAPRFGDSDIAVDGQGNVHLVWGRNIGYEDGRWHQWSQDGGDTWSAPELLFRGIDYASGSTGGYGFAVDSAGILHLVNSFGDRQQGFARAYYIYWNGYQWAEPVLLLERHAHYARLVVTMGNHLHFFALSGSVYDIWYRHNFADAPSTALLPIPSVATAGQLTVTPQATATPVLVTTPHAVLTRPLDSQPPQSIQTQVAPVIVRGIAPVMLLVLMVIGLTQASSGRRHG